MDGRLDRICTISTQLSILSTERWHFNDGKWERKHPIDWEELLKVKKLLDKAFKEDLDGIRET
jgi:hypothetical protein